MAAGKPTERRWTEVVVAIVLSTSGVMTSWASFQGGLWSGQQAIFYSRAGELRVLATRARLQADTRLTAERALFNSWLEAEMMGEAKLAAFYRSRFPPNMQPAFEEWLAQSPFTNPDAPPGPFIDPDYRPAGAEQVERLDRQADAALRQGETANRVADLFKQGALLLATSLFFGGIGQVFRNRRLQQTLVAVAVLACAAGLLRILTLPLSRPG